MPTSHLWREGGSREHLGLSPRPLESSCLPLREQDESDQSTGQHRATPGSCPIRGDASCPLTAPGPPRPTGTGPQCHLGYTLRPHRVMHWSWQTQPVGQSQEAQMGGSDNKMNDDYWKGERKGNQRGPIQPKKQRDGRGSAGRTWYRTKPKPRVLPGTEMAELQSMGQQKGLSPGARLLPSYLSFLICTMGATPPPCTTILRLREHTVCELVNMGCTAAPRQTSAMATSMGRQTPCC